MYRMNSVLKTRLHGFALTHDGGRLFSALMGGLVLAWMFIALMTTGALCIQGTNTAEAPAKTMPVVCEAVDSAQPDMLLRCVIEPSRSHDI